MSQVFQIVVTIVLFILILGGLVLVHEVGHFVTARLAKVRVLEFGIGFPPRARILRRGGETLYSLNWLPIGGFVKLEGEDGDAGDDPRSFSRQRLPLKMVILVAGVLMNLLVAFVIFAGIALIGEPRLGLKIGVVVPGSPAEGIGLQAGDSLVSVNGRQYSRFDLVLNRPDPTVLLHRLAGQAVVIGVIHPDGTSQEYAVTLRVPTTPDRGALGVDKLEPTNAGTIDYGLGGSVVHGVENTAAAFGMILEGLGSLGHSIVTSPTTAPPAAGPVGIAAQIGNIAFNLGPLYLAFMIGLLSANLALVNILPFPPLDGGRMLMIALKAIPGVGGRISLRAEQLTYAIGFVALFGFLIWITVFDIARQFGGGTP
jgi:regulator of sigma E protease